METVVLTILVPIVVGAFVSLWVAEHAKRPRLVIEGGGMQSGVLSLLTLRITNVPGFVGLRLGRTVIFGKRVHGHIEKGIDVARRRATDCRAALFEEGTLRAGIPLWMRVERDGELGSLTHVASLESGEYATIYVIGRRASDDGVLVFAPWLETGGEPGKPGEAVKFSGTRQFVVRAFTTRRRPVEYRFSVVKGAEGEWAIETRTRRQQSRSPF